MKEKEEIKEAYVTEEPQTSAKDREDMAKEAIKKFKSLG